VLAEPDSDSLGSVVEVDAGLSALWWTAVAVASQSGAMIALAALAPSTDYRGVEEARRASVVLEQRSSTVGA
jgi:hypothetical protein